MTTDRPIIFCHPEDSSLTHTGYGRAPDWYMAYLSHGGTHEEMARAAVAAGYRPASSLPDTEKPVTVTEKKVLVQAPLDGIPPPPKKRGRPATGQALTAAERKRAQRQRDRDRFANLKDSEMTLTGLLEAYSTAMSMGNFHDAANMAAELLRRAQASIKK
ncbi:MAG: hypothetical protein H5T99_01570 [Moorella sp. (in: Bacteria)]|nr:hypothetical protein [Moorella sp. (in: firmicutes)]